jgi:hypothetical protein
MASTDPVCGEPPGELRPDPAPQRAVLAEGVRVDRAGVAHGLCHGLGIRRRHNASRWKRLPWNTSGRRLGSAPRSCTRSTTMSWSPAAMLGLDAAVVPRAHSVQHHRAVGGRLPAQLHEAVGTLPGELAAHLLLIGSDHADAEPPGVAQQRPGRGGMRDADGDQRRLERHRRERAGQKPHRGAVEEPRDQGDARREGGEDSAQVSGIEPVRGIDHGSDTQIAPAGASSRAGS